MIQSSFFTVWSLHDSQSSLQGLQYLPLSQTERVAVKTETAPAVRTLPQQNAPSRQPVRRGKRIPASTQIMTNHFAEDNGAEAI